MILKVMGAALMVACGAVLGTKRLAEAGKKISLLEDLDAALASMEAEISLCLRPLPDIFSRLSLGKGGELFQGLSEMCDSMSAGEAWTKWCGELDIPWEAKRSLGSLGDILGAYDARHQGAEITAVRTALGCIREGLQREKDSKQRHYPMLGACLAGIAAMLII